MMNLKRAGIAVLFAGMMAFSTANAATITTGSGADANGKVDDTLTSTWGGALLFTFISRRAAFDSDVLLQMMGGGETFVLDNSLVPGTTFMSAGPAMGAEIWFRLAITSGAGAGDEFFSGDLTRNVDGYVHAMITALGGGIFEVGFEDLTGPFSGIEPDYDDFVFTVQEVPIPGAAILLLSGLAGLGFAGRKKQA